MRSRYPNIFLKAQELSIISEAFKKKNLISVSIDSSVKMPM